MAFIVASLPILIFTIAFSASQSRNSDRFITSVMNEEHQLRKQTSELFRELTDLRQRNVELKHQIIRSMHKPKPEDTKN